jgi:pimeloyl-ACP methyl ester carboxylesterase
VAKLNVLGWSWGTAITALYTSQNNAKVNRLVLYAPVWLRESKSLTDSGRSARRLPQVTVEAALKRKAAGIPEGKKPMPDAWADEWVRATFASDPVGAKANPRFVRAPNGVVQDSREYWSAGKALYDPANIRVPTMLVLAEWDADTPLYHGADALPEAGQRRSEAPGDHRRGHAQRADGRRTACSSSARCSSSSTSARPTDQPSFRSFAAFSLRMSGRTSGLMASFSKSAIQRSGLITG